MCSLRVDIDVHVNIAVVVRFNWPSIRSPYVGRDELYNRTTWFHD